MSKQLAHTDRAHAKYFSPSKADTWITCTASPKFIESLDLPERKTAAADEGTAAHELLEKCLVSGKPPSKFKGQKFNGYEADEDMCNHIDKVFQWCRSYQLQGYHLYPEMRVNIAVTGDSGTLDMALWHPDDKHLVIADLKYGKGYAVDAVKNRQMRLYACGFMDDRKLWNDTRRLTLAIWQPRVNEDVSEWEDSVASLMHFRTKVAEIVEAINKGRSEFKPSEKACKWCPAKAQCKSYATDAAKAMRLDFKQLVAANGISTPSCDALTVAELTAIWTNIEAVTAWLKAVNERLTELATQGKAPGLKIVEGRSNRAWTSEGDAMDLMVRLGLKPDEFAPRSIVGIVAAEKLLPKDKRDLLRSVIHKPPGKPTLALESDPRPSPVASMALTR
jgi:hypothetical protein